MEQRFYCAAWPDRTAVQHRLQGIAGLGAVQMDADGRGLTVEAASMKSAHEAEVRLRELGWRRGL